MRQLAKIDDNFTAAWAKYEPRAGYYALFTLVLGLASFGLILLLIGLIGAASYPALSHFFNYLLSEKNSSPDTIFVVWLVFAFVLLVIGANAIGAWQKAALWIAYLAPEKLKFSQIFKQAIPLAPRYFRLGLLKGVIVFAGYVLFIVPGVLFSVWFAFSEIAAQKKSIIDSLKESRSLVTNRWWTIALRLALGLVITIVIPQIVSSSTTTILLPENGSFNIASAIGILIAFLIAIFQGFFLKQWYNIFKYSIYLDAQKSLESTPSELPEAQQAQ